MRRARLNRQASLLILCAALCFALVAAAQVGLPIELRYEPDAPASVQEQRTFEVTEPGLELGVTVSGLLDAGRVSMDIVAPDGEKLWSVEFQERKVDAGTVGPLTQTGTYTFHMQATDAVGQWLARIGPVPEDRALWFMVLSGFLMIVVGVGTVVWWKWRTGAMWRWFALGAALWIIAIPPKAAMSIVAVERVRDALQMLVPDTAADWIAGLYIGFQSAVFEIGVTIVAVLIWRRLAHNAARGLAIGFGAGGFEAALLGLYVAVSMALGLMDFAFSDIIRSGLATQVMDAPLVWLAPPVERIQAIAAHAACRGLAFYGAVTGRWRHMAYGFLLFTILDGIAGILIMTGTVTHTSAWWMELALLPVTIAGILVIRWLIRAWPKPADSVEN